MTGWRTSAAPRANLIPLPIFLRSFFWGFCLSICLIVAATVLADFFRRAAASFFCFPFSRLSSTEVRAASRASPAATSLGRADAGSGLKPSRS